MLIHINAGTDCHLSVDPTKTFMAGGGLPVDDGEEIVPVIRDVLMPKFEANVATVDMHPYGHISNCSSYSGIAPFTQLTPETVADWNENRIASPHFGVADLREYLANCIGGKQTIWPNHGLDHWDESRLHPALRTLVWTSVLVKGHDPRCDSYSAFRDNLNRSTFLAEHLRDLGIRRVFLSGLVFQVCVGFTALNAVEEGFKTYVVEDATRDLQNPEGAAEMRARLVNAGVSIVTSDQLVRA